MITTVVMFVLMEVHLQLSVVSPIITVYTVHNSSAMLIKLLGIGGL